MRITNPSPPSGWVEDFHLRAIEHARHTTNPLAREGSELGVRRLLSERIAVVPTQSSDRRSCDGSDDRVASTDDRRHDGSQPLASNPTILRLRGCQVQPVLRLLAGSAGHRGGSRLSASLGRARLVVVSYLNQVSCTLRFFFGVTLGRPEAFDRIISAKEPKKLPVVLSGEEIVRFLQAVPGLRNRAALTTAYGAGLRVCEVAALKVGDIDSSRMVIRVEHGKGGKDRYVMLSPQLLRILRAYWRLAKPAAWLFPGRQPDRPVSTATLQAACRVAAREADLAKPVTVHTLRHSFATPLLEAGTAIRIIQVLPQPALPKVPRVGACSVARRPTVRVAAGTVLPRRLHGAGADR